MGLYWGLEHHEAIKFQLNVIHEAAQKWPELHELLLLQYIDKNLRVCLPKGFMITRFPSKKDLNLQIIDLIDMQLSKRMSLRKCLMKC